MGQLPLLEVEGQTLAQSLTIARYLARQHGLAGNTDIAAAEADMVIDSLTDLMGPDEGEGRGEEGGYEEKLL